MTKNTKIIIGVVVAVIVVCGIAYGVSHGKVSLTKTDTAQADVAKDTTQTAEVQNIIAEVSKHIVLPANEVPTAAVVSDLSKLAGQQFFERAQLGDVVLVYANVRRVVLWRPSSQKIVEVSAINFPTAPAGTETVKKGK